jgi:purine-binding chemotaxis protein CheW
MQMTDLEQYVEFGIEDQRYALGIQDIHEIIKIQDITQIPSVMPYVKGVINLRGKIVPVISLRNLFNLPEKEYCKLTRIVVTRHQGDTVGIIVDSVNKVSTFSEIQPPRERVGGVDGNLFVGIGLTQRGMVGILELDQVLVQA